MLLLLCTLTLLACDDGAPSADSGPDGDADVGDVLDADDDDGGTAACASDAECDDGVYCNGDEVCDPGAAGVDDRGCLPSAGDPCPADQVCSEEDERCLTACDSMPDVDGDGHRAEDCGGDDCDDADPDRYPGNTEVCDAEDHDEDCDPRTYGFRDSDGDSYPDHLCCNRDEGGSETCGSDCDDANPSVHPALAESCDGLDNDCNGEVDEGVLRTFYPDVDGDGFGNPTGVTAEGCSPPDDYVENHSDCDDSEAGRNPGLAEVCDLIHDNDCDDTTNPFDADSDDHDRVDCGGDDCDDADETTYPGAVELCDRLDNDCSAGGGVAAAEDGDDDGYAPLDAACEGGPLPRTDCDDERAESSPEGVEVCNGHDDDCDGTEDQEPVASTSCGTPEHTAEVSCVEGVCTLTESSGRWLDCDSEFDTGYEVDPLVSTLHCGACGDGCLSGATCEEGTCLPDVIDFRGWGGEGNDYLVDVALDDGGNIYLLGGFEEPITFGDDPLVSTGSTDVFLVSLDPVGTHIWSTSFGTDCGDFGADRSDDRALGLGVDGSGTSFVAMNTEPDCTWDVEGGPFEGVGSRSVIASFDSDGLHRWSIPCDSCHHKGCDLDTSAGDRVSIASGDLSVFLAGYAGGGEQQWARSYWANSLHRTRLAADGEHVFIAGGTDRSIDLGGGPLEIVGREDNIYVAAFAPDGEHRWSTSFGDAGETSYATGLAIGPDGGLTVAGVLGGVIDFGGGSLDAADGDSFVVSFDSDGGHRWSTQLDGSSERLTLRSGSGDDVLLSGVCDRDVLVIGEVSYACRNRRAFVTLLGVDGVPLWMVGIDGAEHAVGLWSASGEVLVVGNFSDSLDVGGEILDLSHEFDTTDIFMVRLQP